MELLTTEQIQNIDRRTIEKMGVPSLDLMENAGKSVAETIDELFTDFETLSVIVVCGKGNNGGDGFVAARYLEEWGFSVRCFLISKPEDLKGDAAVNYNRAIGAGIQITPLENIGNFEIPEDIDVVVDALFGTGFKGNISGIAADLVRKINDSLATILSVDCPSGVNTTTGEISDPCISADYTVTFARPKVGLYLYPGRDYTGEVFITDIGIPDTAVQEEHCRLFLTTPQYIFGNLPDRPSYGYKGTFGRLYLLSGSMGLTGSAALASESALRAGCGMARLGCPSSLNDILEVKLTEVMTHPLPEVKKRRCFALRGLGEIRKEIKLWADAVAIGPGIGTYFETRELIRRLVPTIGKPTVIDADGLNNLAECDAVFKQIDFPCVLTPHIGELSRLTGNSMEALSKDRFSALCEAAKRFGAVIVFKGSPMLVGDSTGRIFLNPTGNSGMGTAGSGDVLTGIIGSFLAQGMDAFPAAVCGTYVLGAAGDAALEACGNRGLIAGDIRDFIPDVLLGFE
ncbi:MAG: bifunctional ADP-dependent NAD(P)H-hydrate dehydratase/NAD(P)H-hydrate epimerase [candidate division Zixibacteria bacterium CG_4_9_14_3_um_filter_46_8]|nr:MAG: bifunctional ADP-dependent NAD(P)H-hydrate dehydratase/NAD(P)H-hydrate epimerase [candidate division Zixibacteria bacterium CG_4_9_14_3_um_filter_46_8]